MYQKNKGGKRMKKILMMMLMMVMISLMGCFNKTPEGMVLVTKGSLSDIGNGKIEIKEDFYIGKYEVTQGEFEAIMGFNPSYFKGHNLPVEQVTWYDAVMYCNKLSKKENLPAYYSISGIEKNEYGKITKANVNISGGKGYRLPTEAEWEYAARGGNKSKGYKYSGSDNIDDVAWYWINSGDKRLSGEWDYDKIEANNGRTRPVGSKTPNELGIYDMSGNVFEWTFTLDSSGRVVRGGGWGSDADDCEVSLGVDGNPDLRGNGLGFRVLRTY